MILTLRWRVPERPVTTRWRGPEGMLAAVARNPSMPIAAIVAASGGGDVVGPESATDSAVARFDGTTGKLIQNSAVTIDDNGGLSATLAAANTANQHKIGRVGIGTNGDGGDQIDATSPLLIKSSGADAAYVTPTFFGMKVLGAEKVGLSSAYNVAPDTLFTRVSAGVLAIGNGATNDASAHVKAGLIESTAGGFKFPDGSVQSTAAGPPSRFDVVSPAGTWTITHGLGRVPAVQVFLASGEAILPDITVDATHITATFASPRAGFVLAS